MKNTEVMVVGSRMWTHIDVTKKALEAVKTVRGGKIVLCHRGRSGGEMAAVGLGKSMDIDSILYHVETQKDGAWAQWACTARMLAQNPNLVLAFVDDEDDSVWESIRTADALGFPVWVYDKNGKVNPPLPPSPEDTEAGEWWIGM